MCDHMQRRNKARFHDERDSSYGSEGVKNLYIGYSKNIVHVHKIVYKGGWYFVTSY